MSLSPCYTPKKINGIHFTNSKYFFIKSVILFVQLDLSIKTTVPGYEAVIATLPLNVLRFVSTCIVLLV